jgi:hypothetical protein
LLVEGLLATTSVRKEVLVLPRTAAATTGHVAKVHC